MEVSVVVPAYNSAASLAALVERLQNVLSREAAKYELILVNDGSPDRTWEAIEELAARYSWITGINLTKNYGQHNALLCGIREARYGVIVTLDDDLQNPPEEVPKLLAKLEDGFDVVYGKPAKEQHGFWRDMASVITKFTLQKAMGAATARNVGPFRAFRTSVRSSFAEYRGAYVNIDCLLTWGTSRFAALSVRHDPRTAGVSNYTFRKLMLHSLNMITGFSTLPLRIAAWVGFVFTCVGILVLIFVVGRYLAGGSPVAGFPFLASIIAIFSGAQLFALGIIGEYLARMYVRTSEQPAYVVRETRTHT